MTICYNYASRSRADKFFAGLDNICQLSASQDYFVIAKLDEDDTAMNIPYVWERLKSYPEVTVKWGHSKSKIHAINRDLTDIPPYDILINYSDDMRFTALGFDNEIREQMKKFFPDGDGFIHLPDDYAQERVATMAIMGKKFFDRFGYIYHPDYYSLFCDDEQTDVAKALNKYVFVPIHLIEHQHYVNGKTGKDELYRRNDTYGADKQIYERRKQLNFPL